ncbi:hypothetical protein CEE37_09560 [candidate division LCP-89 bacterium B3_LCP]|uniref:Pilus assembly protein PilO n=1 Tax=candidate division LCP-89 bacterium B3_LCP TaxID=2012998 RepID=A0A532UYF1_UNCL8|nr:MAG: hypothetical protein CEE37_09560 [candidate division LCP-89 bacterium B3_LCP]
MRKVLILVLIAVVFGGGFWLYHNFLFPKYPQDIANLDREINIKNEELISAEILAQEMDLVARLIERNLALSTKDSLAEDASMPFLNFVTNMLQDLEIKLIVLEPKKRRAQVDYIKTPYFMTIECTYYEFGKLVALLEKSERLITLESFAVDNGFRQATATRDFRDPEDHIFEMQISTLTLIKRM